MASVAQPEISELEKKAAAGEEEENPEEAMDDEEDEEEDDVEEDVAVEIGATYSCKRPDGNYHDAEIVKTRMNKRAGREEFFVQYVGLNRRQNEWVDKTRLVIPKPVKEGQVANSAGPEMAENGNTALKRKNDDGTSEAKRVKVDDEIAPTTSGDFDEELTCLLCSELFKDPVMVECGHNFCRNCTDKAWSGQESFTCPDCKEVITDKRYTTNRALANLVKKTVGAKKPKPSENCPQHEERLKLYCKDDGTLSCIICRDSLIHANHNFLPILDAVKVCRTELSTIVAPLEEALKVTEQLTTQQSEKVEQHKINVSESRQHIVSEFETLRTFLKEREEKLLERLEEQGKNLMKEIETSMEKLQENQENIKETITMANERMNDTDSKSFLTGVKQFIEKCQEQQNAVMVAGNKRFSKDLCQGTFKGPIQYFIWKEMKSFVVPAAAIRGPTVSGGPGKLTLPSTARPATEQPTASLQDSAVTENCRAEKTVWIVGHSLVHSARVRAARHSNGTQLGLPTNKCQVFWFGQKWLKWDQMQQLMAGAANEAPAPDILVIHAGGNDLTNLRTSALINYIKEDINSWLARWPGVKVVWSPITQRKYWRFADHVSSVEKSRKGVNTAIAKFVLSKGGLVLDHEVINFKCDQLYRSDGEQLSDIGIDIFNKSVHDLLECYLGADMNSLVEKLD